MILQERIPATPSMEAIGLDVYIAVRRWGHLRPYPGGDFEYFLFSALFGKVPILTNIFQMGWNHQPVMCLFFFRVEIGEKTCDKMLGLKKSSYKLISFKMQGLWWLTWMSLVLMVI